MWNLAAITRRTPGHHAGWWTAVVLGALLTWPAVPASADKPNENASARSSSSGSKSSARSSSSSSPKASSRSSAPASRSGPRASGRSSSPSRPRASSQPRAPRASRPAAERPVRRQREIRNERSRPLRQAPERLEPASPRRAPQPPAPPVARPLPPVDPPAGSRHPSPSDRFEPDDVDDQRPDLRRRVEIQDPDLGDRHHPPISAAPRHRPRERPRYRGWDGYRHRHYYGCGHYGFGYGYDPFYLYRHGFYSPFFYWGLGYHGAYWPDVYYYGGGGSSSTGRELGTGALDLDVSPDRAEVYVDGRYVGIADQFDGFPTYLWLDEGTYELAFYLEGYETVFRQYTIYPGVTIDVDLRLKRGESIRPDAHFAPESRSGPVTEPAAADLGRLAVAATPDDAAVYLDGHFVGTAAEIASLPAGLIVEPGDHVIEVIRPGYESASAPITLAAGERVDLKLDLERR